MVDHPVRRVLLVEDNELDARTIRLALRGHSDFINTELVRSLAEAVQACKTQQFDAVLLDLSLPDSDGLDTLHRILNEAPTLPVIVLTGLNDPQAAFAAVENGAQDYLEKASITPDLLVRALRYAMARHHADVELRRARLEVDSLNTREEIARDLHDTVIQRLFALGMHLQGATRLTHSADVLERLNDAVDEIDGTIRELRSAIFGLQHPVDDFGGLLQAMVERHVGENLACSVEVEERIELLDHVAQDLLAMIREAVSNVSQHAQADALYVTVRHVGSELIATVQDNGTGFDHSGDGPPEAAVMRRGNGIQNLLRRADRHGGAISYAQVKPQGTVLEVRLPATQSLS